MSKRPFPPALAVACLICALPVCRVLAGDAGPQPKDSPPACSYDRAKMLALSQRAFDQDMHGGWRALAERKGCREAAADLIRDYRRHWKSSQSILFWHEGQLRAMIGQKARAISLFEKARFTGPDPGGWNLYVDATIAFMRKNLVALRRDRDALARMPRPTSWPPRDAYGHVVNISWPPNLNVVDGLIRCFRQPYKDAYANCSRLQDHNAPPKHALPAPSRHP